MASDFSCILFDQQDRNAVAVQVLNDIKDLIHQQRREAHGRLIQHQQLRMAHQGTAHGQHLLLAAGQSAGNLTVSFLQAGKEGIDLFDIRLYFFVIPLRVSAHQQVFVNGKLLENAASFGYLSHAQFNDFVAGGMRNILTIVGDNTVTGWAAVP